ncbi:MAG: hypothetical protein GXO89_03050 [Chlorobi bacterium]|nr:hypothetical protein [Chlorobiota bacterium]
MGLTFKMQVKRLIRKRINTTGNVEAFQLKGDNGHNLSGINQNQGNYFGACGMYPLFAVPEQSYII